jgi:hypothetical protein
LHLVSVDSEDLEERPTSFYKINKNHIDYFYTSHKNNMLADRKTRKEYILCVSDLSNENDVLIDDS